MGENIIEVKGLEKSYGERHAVNGVSFAVGKNEVLGLLGPNGAGKSTIMNIIAGCITADGGTVEINSERAVGYLPEIPPIYSELTVDEYIEYACGIKKLNYKSQKDNISGIKKSLGLQDYGKRLIRNLSKGYKQRVGFAQALLGEPEIIILDEPTVGLDPKQIIEIRKLITTLGKKHTVIFSSHTLSEVNSVCDRVIILDSGRIAAMDNVEKLSKRVGGDTGIFVNVCAPKGEAAGVLKSTPGVKKVRDAQELDGNPCFIVSGDMDDVQLRKNIFNAFSKKGYPIIAMRRDDLSLEDVFLRVTGR